MNIKVYHVLTNGAVSIIDDIDFDQSDTYLRADNAKLGKYKRLDYDVAVHGSGLEGIVLYMNQRAIGSFYFEIRYFLNESN